MASIVRCFLDTNMALAHDGLSEIAKRAGIKINDLEPGEYVAFVNRAKDRFKIYAAQNVIAYWRARKGDRLDLRVIREIPRVFNGSAIGDYDKALERVLAPRLAKASPLIAAKRMKELNG